jgi:cytochrome c-type biogenesis protein CcmE
MSNSGWEKNPELSKKLRSGFSQRRLYMFAGLVLVGIVGFLVVQSTLFGSRYYITVDELLEDSDMVGKSVRISGAVDGNMVEDGDYEFDPETQTLIFWVTHIPNDSDKIRDAGGLSKVLYDAVNDPEANRIKVVYHDAEIPELLQHEAQAIMEGKLGDDGVFYAESLSLKCPTKYADDNPGRVAEDS